MAFRHDQRYRAAVFSMRRPSPSYLASVVAVQTGCELTYAEHGATAGLMPSGYQHDQWEIDLGGFDEVTFDRLGVELLGWRVQRGAGLSVHPLEPVKPGLTFAFWFRFSGVYVTAAGRVVYVTSEADRRGFAYGTLPQHPEQGEEAFHLVKEGGRMLFRVTAFSRPRHPLARLGAPVSRIVQVRMNQAYLQVMRSATSGSQP
jgi:uncharacterized protein (UPF0548 family)